MEDICPVLSLGSGGAVDVLSVEDVSSVLSLGGAGALFRRRGPSVVLSGAFVVVVAILVVDSLDPPLKSEFIVSGALVVVIVAVVVESFESVVVVAGVVESLDVVSQVSMSATLIDGPHKSTLTS